jgi:hypothetical protein
MSCDSSLAPGGQVLAADVSFYVSAWTLGHSAATRCGVSGFVVTAPRLSGSMHPTSRQKVIPAAKTSSDSFAGASHRRQGDTWR